MKNLVLIAVLFSLSSCAFHSGIYQSSASITNNQFRIAGKANGKAETIQLLGIGGLYKNALVQEALNNLHQKYPLQKAMLLGNVTVDFKTSYLLILRKTQVIINADIIDFNPETINANYKGFYTEDSTFFPARIRSIENNYPYTTDINGYKIKVNDEVTLNINGSAFSGKIIGIDTFGIKCLYETPNGSRKIYLLPQDITLKSR